MDVASTATIKSAGSDGPWARDTTNKGQIYKAEVVWNMARPLDLLYFRDVRRYLEKRRVLDVALTCDQLRQDYGLDRVLPLRSGPVLLARIWHVQQGFVGVHATLIEDVGGGDGPQRAERRTLGVCSGGAVWFGTVTPDAALVVGEVIETVLSAMVLWGASAGAATFGTAGLEALVLPRAARRVVIAADNDPPEAGKRAGKGQHSARVARNNWLAIDPRLDISIRVPMRPETDWNDVLMESVDA